MIDNEIKEYFFIKNNNIYINDENLIIIINKAFVYVYNHYKIKQSFENLLLNIKDETNNNIVTKKKMLLLRESLKDILKAYILL